MRSKNFPQYIYRKSEIRLDDYFEQIIGIYENERRFSKPNYKYVRALFNKLNKSEKNKFLIYVQNKPSFNTDVILKYKYKKYLKKGYKKESENGELIHGKVVENKIIDTIRCSKCNSNSTYIRIRTKERVCKKCGFVEDLKKSKEESENEKFYNYWMKD